jgi:hypothetical protein
MADVFTVPTNTSTVNFDIYPRTSVQISNSTDTSDEYVNTVIINKSLAKLLLNYSVLISYFNYKFTGIYTPGTVIVSSDIKPLSTPQKLSIATIIDDNFFVGINEKTAPQVLTRIFSSLLQANSAILQQTNIEISNLDDALKVVTAL